MKGYVVLAYELEELDLFGIPPPCLPLIGEGRGNRNISDRRIEPNVEHLVFVALLWDRNAPFEVPGDSALAKAVSDPCFGHFYRVVGPVPGLRRGLHPRLKLRQDRRQVDVQMIRLPGYRRFSAGITLRVLELRRIEQLATVLTLIASRALVVAMRADSSYIPIGEKTRTAFAVELLDGLLIDIAGLIEPFEDTLSYLGVLRCRGPAPLVK